MRRAAKTSVAALVALLFALGAAACGGDDSDSAGTESTSRQSQGNAADDASRDAGDSRKNGSGENGSGEDDASGGDASDFVPKQHDDSGGGSEQFKVKGGDNSVQEFGEEADSEELAAAAVALHNFFDARAEGNWAAACEYMSKATVESFEQLAARGEGIDDSSCGAILEGLTNPAAGPALREEAAKADVGSLRVEGDRSFVIYTGLEGSVLAMPMTNEDGEWKVAGIAGTPLS